MEEMTIEEIAVDGYYVVSGIARHEYKQGSKFVARVKLIGILGQSGRVSPPSSVHINHVQR